MPEKYRYPYSHIKLRVCTIFLDEIVKSKTKIIGVKVHYTKDKKKLKIGLKEYEYGTVNIKDPKLRGYIGKTVRVKIFKVMEQ